MTALSSDTTLRLGGGHPVRYEAGDPQFFLSAFADHVHRSVQDVCARLRLPLSRMHVVGRYCEAGDVLASDVLLPSNTYPGDLVAVATTGVYHATLAK